MDEGISGLFGKCSTTAQRGALDWLPVWGRTLEPVFMGKQVISSGFDPAATYTPSSGPDMVATGRKVSELRPENSKK